MQRGVPCPTHPNIQLLYHKHHSFSTSRFDLGIDRKLWGFSSLDVSPKSRPFKKIVQRAIPRHPERILDAPGLNKQISSPALISWNKKQSILAVALNTSLYLWEERMTSICGQLSVGVMISCVHWISSSIIAIGAQNGLVLLWEYSTNRQIILKRPNEKLINIITSGPCGTIVAGDIKGSLFLFNSFGETRMKILAHHHSVIFISFEHHGILATSDAAGVVHCWKLNDATLELVLFSSLLQYVPFGRPIKAIGWCPWKPALLAIAGPSSISLWNIRTSSLISEVSFNDSYKLPISVQWWNSEAPPMLVVVHANYEISLWSLPSLKLVSRIIPDVESTILHSCWTGSRLISIAAEERILFHSLSHLSNPPCAFPSPVNSPLNSSKSLLATFETSKSPRSPSCTISKRVSSASSRTVGKSISSTSSEIFSPESRRLLFGGNS